MVYDSEDNDDGHLDEVYIPVGPVPAAADPSAVNPKLNLLIHRCNLPCTINN